VGAFRRAYSVQEAIEEFLPKVYAPNAFREDRYDYLPGHARAGLTVYEDGVHAYSYHDSDPAHGHVLNAFDLVRIHLFPEDGDEKKSNSAMLETARKDKKVIAAVSAGDENETTAADDFWDTKDSGENDADRKSLKKDKEKLMLDIDRKGNVINRTDNYVKIINFRPEFQNVSYNEYARALEFVGPASWKRPGKGAKWTDDDDAQAQLLIEKEYGLWGPEKYRTALGIIQQRRAFHPVKDYFNSLKWDGVKRLDTLLVDYLGAADCALNRAISRKTLTAAVARTLCPGTKFDYMLVLVGRQGIGKSTFFSKLGGDYYADTLSLNDLRDSKTAPEKLQGLLIQEVSELSGMRKTEIEAVKSFLSTCVDRYRPAYGRVVEERPRTCVIVGTTNAENGFLQDTTGNRRFWPVKVTGQGAYKPWDMTPEIIDQIWAEAVLAYKAEEKLFLEGELAQKIEKLQTESLEGDEREGVLQVYLNRKLPDDWNKRSVYERRGWFAGDEEGTVKRKQVCAFEIWRECFSGEESRYRRREGNEIRAMLKRLGWRPVSNPRRQGPYGPQRVYERKKKE